MTFTVDPRIHVPNECQNRVGDVVLLAESGGALLSRTCRELRVVGG